MVVLDWQIENIKASLEKFAKLKKFDPREATNWYTVPREELQKIVCFDPQSHL